MVLNKAQAQELAKFFFDVAKGLILGGIGFSTVTPFELKLIIVILTSMTAYILVRLALSLLKEVK